MATLILRTTKGTPLTNAELDNNFQYLNNALGANGPSVPTPTGTINGTTSVPVLSLAPTITSANLVSPALGTPVSGVLTNCTGTASGLTAGNVITNANLTGAITSIGNATSLGSFTSLQLLNALTDETGSGANVFANSPTLVTPNIGTPSVGVLTNCTGTASGLTAGTVTNGVYTVGNQTIGGVKTFTSDITGNISGNAGTVTNGVYSNLTYANPSWITSLDGAKITSGVIPNARLNTATTSIAGIVQLNDTTSSTSTTQAATANAVNTLATSISNLSSVSKITNLGSWSATNTLASYTITGIPSWARRVTVYFLGFGVTGTNVTWYLKPVPAVVGSYYRNNTTGFMFGVGDIATVTDLGVYNELFVSLTQITGSITFDLNPVDPNLFKMVTGNIFNNLNNGYVITAINTPQGGIGTDATMAGIQFLSSTSANFTGSVRVTYE